MSRSKIHWGLLRTSTLDTRDGVLIESKGVGLSEIATVAFKETFWSSTWGNSEGVLLQSKLVSQRVCLKQGFVCGGALRCRAGKVRAEFKGPKLEANPPRA